MDDSQREWLASLFAKYRNFLLWWATRSLGNKHDAEDVVQEVMTIASDKIDNFEDRGEGSGEAWLREILRLQLLAFGRSRQRRSCRTRRLSEEHDIIDPAPSVEVLSARTEFYRRALDLRWRLPEEERMAIELIDLQGRTYREAARIMGCSATRVHQLRHSGLRRLTQLLLGEPNRESDP